MDKFKLSSRLAEERVKLHLKSDLTTPTQPQPQPQQKPSFQPTQPQPQQKPSFQPTQPQPQQKPSFQPTQPQPQPIPPVQPQVPVLKLRLKTVSSPLRIKSSTKTVLPQPPTVDLWSEKYRPQQLQNLVGNKSQIDQIKQWFEQFKARDNTIKKALLLSGCPGTSKTTVAHLVLREFGYDVKEYNASDIRSKKLVEDQLNKLISMEQVDKHFRDDSKPFGVIMDEVDGMSSGDKGGMNQLIKTINPLRGQRCVKKVEKQKLCNRWIPPIICICNDNYTKIKDLKKDCLEIRFNKPTIAELIKVIQNIAQSEHMKLTPSAETKIAELAQGDFRRLMFLLQHFSGIQKPCIDINDVYEYYEVISKKNLDLNSFEITDKIFSKHTSVEDILKLYETDKSLLPMMIHENYVTVACAQNTNEANKMRSCLQCIDSIINGDLIDKMMYNNQSWYLQPIHGMSACYLPSQYTNLYPKLGHGGAQWTTFLGKFSARCANMGTITSISSNLNTGRSYTVDDIQLLSQIILFQLLDPKGDQQIGLGYMLNYNMEFKYIKDLIKIDRLNDKYKKLYQSRQSKRLKELLNTLPKRNKYTIAYNTNDSKRDQDDDL
jgi:DNA polymerase III delta prime subunit